MIYLEGLKKMSTGSLLVSNLERLFVLIPAAHNLLVQPLVERVAIAVGHDDTFETRRIGDWLDCRLIELYEVVVHFKASTFLVLDDDLSNLQEVVIDSGVIVVPFVGTLDSSGALVDLENDQHLLDQFFTFGNEVLLVQVDSEIFVVADDLKFQDV